MTKFIGNRVGYAISDFFANGGIHNLFSQNYFITNIGTTKATGGSIFTPGNGYTYHIFLAPGVFQATSVNSYTISYLVVAGGGGGGNSDGGTYAGGGGGAGGFRTGTMTVSNERYPITIGAGGAVNSSGSPSTFGSITSTGGGRGGGNAGGNAGPGGSGGGGGGSTNTPVGSGNAGSYSPPEGNPGGPGNSGTGVGGGGGGAGAAGVAAPGPGGVGLAAFSGDTGVPTSYGTPGPTAGRWFAGGGGGGNQSLPGRDGGLGGAGGGGNGLTPSSPGPSKGDANTGGGGAGGGVFSSPFPGQSGGSGIVIIRYLT